MEWRNAFIWSSLRRDSGALNASINFTLDWLKHPWRHWRFCNLFASLSPSTIGVLASSSSYSDVRLPLLLSTKRIAKLAGVDTPPPLFLSFSLFLSLLHVYIVTEPARFTQGLVRARPHSLALILYLSRFYSLSHIWISHTPTEIRAGHVACIPPRKISSLQWSEFWRKLSKLHEEWLIGNLISSPSWYKLLPMIEKANKILWILVRIYWYEFTDYDNFFIQLFLIYYINYLILIIHH